LAHEAAIGIQTFAPLEASMRVTNSMPLGSPLLLPSPPINFVATLKVFGTYIVLVAQGSAEEGCRWPTEDPMGAKACTFMYASYLVLFAKLFKDNYLTPKPKREKAP
jgi:hypothetical protein